MQAQSHMKNSGGEKNLAFFFSFISKEMGGKGVRVEDGGGELGATQQAPKTQSSLKKKSKQNKTHTHRK